MAGLDNGRVCCWAAGSRNIPLGFLQLTDRHPSCVNALTVIGCALFAGYESGDMAIWRLGPADDFQKTYLWALQDFHTDGIRAFASCFSPNFSLDSPFDTSRPSALLLSASADQHLCFWNATNCLQSLSSSSSSSSSPLLLLHSELEAMSINAIAVEWCREGHGDGVSAQPPGHWDRQKTSHWLRVFSASGSGSWDRIIRVFTSDEDGENIRQTGSLRGHEQPVDCLVVVKPYGCEEQNAEGKCRDTCRLVSCSNADGTVRLWDTKMNTQILCLSFLSSPIFTLLQSGDKLFGFSLESEDLFIFQLTSHFLESSSQTSHGIVGLKQQESLRDCCSGITSLAIQRGILYLGTLSGTVKELYL
jgi:WD40 repeat protein